MYVSVSSRAAVALEKLRYNNHIEQAKHNTLHSSTTSLRLYLLRTTALLLGMISQLVSTAYPTLQPLTALTNQLSIEFISVSLSSQYQPTQTLSSRYPHYSRLFIDDKLTVLAARLVATPLSSLSFVCPSLVACSAQACLPPATRTTLNSRSSTSSGVARCSLSRFPGDSMTALS